MQRLILLFLVGMIVLCACSAIAADTQADIIAKRMELTKNKPFTSIVPRASEPTGYINVLRIWPESNEMRIAIGALQGIVNREKPQLYIGIDKPLRWLEYYGGKIVIEPTERDIFKIFEKFKDSVKGIVVYDYSIDALANVAITYAGIEDLIPADPELAKLLSEKYGWKIVHDLRGKWKTRYEAYKWAYDNLLPKCSKYALSHYNHGLENYDDPGGPNSPTLRTGFMVDYAVAFRTFTWHIPTVPTREERELAEQIFESVAFHTPIFGRSATQKCYPEPAFVSWVSRFGNLHIPAGMGNTSVLSGAKVPSEMLIQKPMPEVRDMGPDKIYIAFTNSEHDNLEHVIGGGTPWHRLGMETDDPHRMWWSDPLRGQVPMGWPIGPLLAEIAPTTLAHFNTTATDNDCLMVALSGLSLSDLITYGAAYPTLQDKLLDEYCQMTGDFMKELNWTIAQPSGSPGELRPFIKNIPNLEGIMEGYGMHRGITPEKANYMLDGVPVMHSLAGNAGGSNRKKGVAQVNQEKAQNLANEITAIQLPPGRPGFIHAWTMGWDFGPTSIKMAADLLPPEYVVVRPDELAALYKKYKGDNTEIVSVNPQITPSGRVTETANGNEGLIIDTGKMKAEIGWGEKLQAPIKRIMGVDGKWRGTGRLPHNNSDHTVKAFTYKKIKDTPGEKEYRLEYTFNDDGFMAFNIRAIAGTPYVIVVEESKKATLPSWSFDTYAGFEPNMTYTDAELRPMDYQASKSMGSVPWHRWLLQGKTDSPDRDMIGLITIAWADWTSGEMLCWQRTPGTFYEFFHSRSGTKKFAVAALDRNDTDAPQRIWDELNKK